MDDEAIRRARDAARSLEKRGLVDPAVQTYLRIGDLDAASSALVGARRFGEAARVLVQGLGVPADKAGTLDPGKRKLALKAAICFAQAGEAQAAVELYVGLGEKHRAAELLDKMGDVVGAARLRGAGGGQPAFGAGHGGTVVGHGPVMPGAVMPPRATPSAMTLEAAQRLEQGNNLEMALSAYVQLKQLAHAGRVARQLGRGAEAARLFEEGGMPYEAAVCWMEVGDTGKCLDALVRVSRDDARYRRAAVQAVRLATDLNVLDFHLEHFLTRFVAGGPQDERELESFYLLSRLYQAHDFVENAKDALRKILAVQPGYRDAAARLANLEQETRGSAMVFQKILEEDMSFRRSELEVKRPSEPPPLPDLPDLPALDGPAMTSQATAAWDGRQRPPAVVRQTPGMGRSPSAPPPPAARGTPAMTAALPAFHAPDAAPKPGANAPPPADAWDPEAPVEAMLAEGTTVAQRYRLEKKIGQGGMAAVFKATDLELGETIAIKFFTQIITDEHMLLRFKQELTLSRQLNHPNIVRLYDIGSHRGMRFISMELLTGTDLRARIGKPYTMVDALDWLLQACAGLQAAHDRGVVHRDIKPENFFVTNDATLKIMDFGIAKKTSTQGLTQAGMMAGTPEYMSPEQVTNFANVTYSTDLYALGVIAYELFTGAVPFTHQELLPLLMMHVNQPPAPPQERNPRIPDELAQVILKLLAKQPADRFKSCNDLARSLLSLRNRIAAEG